MLDVSLAEVVWVTEMLLGDLTEVFDLEADVVVAAIVVLIVIVAVKVVVCAEVMATVIVVDVVASVVLFLVIESLANCVEKIAQVIHTATVKTPHLALVALVMLKFSSDQLAKVKNKLIGSSHACCSQAKGRCEAIFRVTFAPLPDAPFQCDMNGMIFITGSACCAGFGGDCS